MKKNDIILFFSTLVIGIVVFLALFFAFSGTADTVVVTVDGDEYARLALNEDTELVINGCGGTNLLVIKDGKAYVTEASCPDKICVKTGEANEIRSIVCAPNKVVITIENKK